LVLFDKVFDKLALESDAFARIDVDRGTVGRDELQNRLVLTGKFNVKDALVIIDEMIHIKKIEEVMLDTYRKVTSNRNREEVLLYDDSR
jgi:hypothetical protein